MPGKPKKKAIERRARLGAPPKIYPSAIVRPGAELGNDVVIGAFCYVDAGARVGAGTRVQSHTSIWAGVTLGEDVFVGPGATFTNVRAPRARYPRAHRRWDETHVGDGATIGAHATLVAPVSVGRCAMIGAGAVITRDVPAHAIVTGVPARVVGFVCECGERLSSGRARPKRATCKRCGATLSL